VGLATTVVEFFLLGLATPLSAVCVVPLYPGFVAYLSAQSGGAGDSARTGYSPAVLGVLVVAGVLAFMLLVGLLFSTVLQTSLTGVIGTVSPVAFGLLALVSVALIADLEVFARAPAVEPPQTSHPAATALLYGFFFGAIVVPCNPGVISFALARQFLVTAPIEKLLVFFAFGLGIGTPLLALAVVSEAAGQRATRLLARHRRVINVTTGAVMLAVSLYYLTRVFDVFGVGTALCVT
jgi:Thiol:disulfide interchange protein